MVISIKVPRLSKINIRDKAEEFLIKYNPQRTFPLEIELIAEKQGIKIYPIPELKKLAGTEGFINPNLTQIGIDNDIYFYNENRARFTIAHEIGHWFLHKDIYEKINKTIKINSFLDYSKLIDEIAQEDYDWIEWQAYFFAGQILVPVKELKRELEKALNSNLLKKFIKDDIAFPIVEDLATVFNVSSQVIRKRLNEDKILNIKQMI